MEGMKNRIKEMEQNHLEKIRLVRENRDARNIENSKNKDKKGNYKFREDGNED